MNKTGIKLQKVIDKNAKLFNMKLIRRKDYPFVFSEAEDYNLTTVLSNELFSWELQMTIGITKEGLIHIMLFMYPVIIKEKIGYLLFNSQMPLICGWDRNLDVF